MTPEQLFRAALPEADRLAREQSIKRLMRALAEHRLHTAKESMRRHLAAEEHHRRKYWV